MNRFRITFLIALVLAAPTFAADLETIDVQKLPGFLAEGTRIENFRNIDALFPSLVIPKAETPSEFERDEIDLSDLEYTYGDKTTSLTGFLEDTVTTGMIVVKNGVIRNEQYFLGHSQDQTHLSMSVAKSFISALVGIAIDEGKIGDVSDPATKYLPQLSDSGYNGVPIEHLLQMSSGIDFSEVYDDGEADINTMFLQLAGGLSIEDYVAKLPSAGPSGEKFHYASTDTQVLGMILEKVYGKPVNEIMAEKLWSKIGMESDAYFGADNHGNSLVFGFLNATLRDYARFGLLYLGKGRIGANQIVPREWIEKSVVPGGHHLMGHSLYGPEWDIGYQYQWWVPDGNQAEFTGIGVWGQYVYVNPAERVVIVKNSVDPDFDTRDMETIAAFRAICGKLRGGGPVPMINTQHNH